MRRSKKKKNHKFLALILLVAVILCFAFDDVDNETSVKIEKGLSTPQIADILKKNDIIPSKTMFLIFVNFSEYKGKLQYGTFNFEEGDGYTEIIRKLATSGAKKRNRYSNYTRGIFCRKNHKKIS